MIMGHAASRETTLAIAQNDRVYASIKILLLRFARKLVTRDGDRHVRETLFRGQPEDLFALDLQGWLRRKRLAFALRE
jgi:porphobilinogen deaminase